MEILLEKHQGLGQERKQVMCKILKHEILPIKTTMLLVRETQDSISDNYQGNTCPCYEFMPIQFIAQCRTDIGAGMLAAFYIEELGDLRVHVLGGLPGPYYQEQELFLVDYQSYLSIASLTGEKTLTLGEYVTEVRSSRIGVNTLLMYQGKGLPYEQQRELWKSFEKAASN